MKFFLGPCMVVALLGTNAAAAEKVQFNRDIRPILSDKCFFCHGPDKNQRKADLRLDVAESALAEGAIVPGKARESEVIARMLSTDPDEVMPPPESKLPAVTQQELELLQRWIDEGAEYQAHWSFIPLAMNRGAGSPAQRAAELDAVLIEELAQQNLALQSRASAETLLRRMRFDVTGLPPTPEEVTAFRADFDRDADAAIASWADRLLALPAYGERMAVDWLDVARYADSYGFQVDRERSVWMWRDWVVKAFNENLPYDQFVTWQLAGDLLPGATDEQVLATAFNRLHQQESEGGSVEEEYRVEYVCDRVQTVATAFLGLTFECARCHDHKFDPVSQADYYGLFSLLQNIDEAGLYSFFTPSAPTPAMAVLSPEERKKRETLEAAEREAEAALKRVEAEETARYVKQIGAEKAELNVGQPLPGEVAWFDFEALSNKREFANRADAKNGAKLNGGNAQVAGPSGQAVRFTGDDAVTTEVGNFHSYEPFSLSLWLNTPDAKDRAVVLHRSRAWTDAASRGYELLIEEGKLKWSLIHFWPGDAVSVRAVKPLPLGQWARVVVTSDGSGRAAGLHLWMNGQEVETEVVRDHLTRDITGGGGDFIALGERFRDRGFKEGMIDELRVFSRELTPVEALALTGGKVDGSSAAAWAQHGLRQDSPAWRQAAEALRAARQARVDFITGAAEMMVMRELAEPKPAYILRRGEYNQRGELTPAAVPAALGPMPEGAPMNRLGLAQWLTTARHPLLARVTVNRVWQGLFGRGLVKTAEDFGSQGEKPRYPELLDALAEGFIQSGWDTKALIKTILLSRIYQQGSTGSAELMRDDPENVLLARGPRFRLPAEMIRDNALAAAGLLQAELGGPPVHPYELKEAYKPFEVKPGASLFRRSLYTTWRRTSPPPAMITFDAPRRAVCSAKRDRTNSPLQALILLNGEQYVEAARVLGERLQAETHGDVDQLISRATLACLSRLPDADERRILHQLYEEQRTHYQADADAAQALRAIGTTPPRKDVGSAEAAAAAVLVQALMNHDECVVKR